MPNDGRRRIRLIGIEWGINDNLSKVQIAIQLLALAPRSLSLMRMSPRVFNHFLIFSIVSQVLTLRRLTFPRPLTSPATTPCTELQDERSPRSAFLFGSARQISAITVVLLCRRFHLLFYLFQHQQQLLPSHFGHRQNMGRREVEDSLRHSQAIQTCRQESQTTTSRVGLLAHR